MHGDALTENPAACVKDQFIADLRLLTTSELNRNLASAEFGKIGGRFQNLINHYDYRLFIYRHTPHCRAPDLPHSALEDEGGVLQLRFVSGIRSHIFSPCFSRDGE